VALSEKEKDVIKLYYIFRKTQKDIALLLDITQEQVREILLKEIRAE